MSSMERFIGVIEVIYVLSSLSYLYDDNLINRLIKRHIV
jgi:hypothetical protein